VSGTVGHVEMSLVGAAFLDASVMSRVSTQPHEFQTAKGRATWAAMRSLEERSQPIDPVTVEAELVRLAYASAGELAHVDVAYLGECAGLVPTADNAVEYSRQIRDRYIGTTVKQSLLGVLEQGKREGASGAELLSMALAALSKIDAEQPDEAQTIGHLIKWRISELARIESGEIKQTGSPTGVAKLDAMIGGWQSGIVSIVAARPGMGKSSLGMATADACSAQNVGVHIFSLEDTRAAYADRALSRVSTVPAEEIRAVKFSGGTISKLTNAGNKLRLRQGWLVDDRSGITASEIVRSVRRHRRDNATRVVIVDYIQLVRWPRGISSAHEGLTANIQTLADAAKQDGVAYVVMSQLNRGLEQRNDKRPQLSDLRESGSLEERAKCVVGLYRGSYYGESPKRGIDYGDDEQAPSGDEFRARCDLVVLKNSNGKTGIVRANWDGPTTRIW